jgi:pilus assembly protein CpaE
VEADFAQAAQNAAADRLLAGARVTVAAGGISAAIEMYHENPTPNLIVLETQTASPEFLNQLDRLADVCDAGTKLLVVGRANDINFYRELVSRGVSEYVLAPIASAALVSAISGIYRGTTPGKLGQTYAFVGAKGGVGSSTIAHNVAWMIGRQLASDVMLVDMDLPFGTASLDFNLEPSQGVADAIQDSSRLDQTLLERLMVKYGDHLGLLSAPVNLDRAYDLNMDAVERLLEVAQASVPFTILDMPHQWLTWSRNVLKNADEVIVVATPELASLRNAKSMVASLQKLRPHDPPPKLVLNQVGIPKRPEIKLQDFAKAVELESFSCISFNPHLFGTAANKGQMLGEVSQKADAVKAIADMAIKLAGRSDPKKKGFSGSRKSSLLARILGKR